jgi:biotin carboxylase
MNKLLVLGGGILQLDVIKKAKELNISTIVIDGNKNAEGLKYADFAYVEDITNSNLILEIATNEKVTGVIHPCSEVAMHVLGMINDQLNLCGISYRTALNATDKIQMRHCFEKFGAPSPFSTNTNNFNDFLTIIKTFNEKVIVKPSRNSGSRGITLLTGDESNEILLDAFKFAMNNSRDNLIVMEEYVEGAEFSVELILFDKEIHIITVTDKKTTNAPHFIEIGHSQPSLYSVEIINLVKDAAIQGCLALNLDWCAAHAEIKICNNKAIIIEIGARLGGDFIATVLTFLSTGIDMIEASIQIALGNRPDLSAKKKGTGTAIRYFTPKPGVLSSLMISEKILNHSDLYNINIYKHIGDEILELNSSSNRSGHVITTNNNVLSAIETAEYLVECINYEIEPIIMIN